jgi:uncharacterized membrane protein YphA (DoxX/SURF4 family)
MKQVGVLAARDALAAVLVTAGAAKLADLEAFSRTLVDLRMSTATAWRRVEPLAVLVASTELISGLGTALGWWPQIFNALNAVLLAGFAAVTAFVLWRKINVNCRCFGSLSDTQFSRRGLTRILLLLAASFAVLLVGTNQANYGLGSTGVLVGLSFILLAVLAAQAARAVELVKDRPRPQ